MGERTIHYEYDPLAPPDWTDADHRTAPDMPLPPEAVTTQPKGRPEYISRRQIGALRRELSALNLSRAQMHPHETTYGNVASILYSADDSGNHGNFFSASYRRILAKPAWSARLRKAYTASSRVPHSQSRKRCELDCANSSDALLMNVFCHPAALRSKHLQALIGIAQPGPPEFGLRARTPLRDGHDDRTELDMVIRGRDGTLLVEAKLSETGFQTARPGLMARYHHFESTFDLERLPFDRGQFRSYQLLRSILAAKHLQARFAVLLDARRTDLIEDTFRIYSAVSASELRSRLHLITWQEIAGCVPRTLQAFLAYKYGIHPAR